MLKFILYFLWFIAFYHIINTLFIWKLWFPKVIVSIFKEIIWFGFILVIVLRNFKKFLEFLKKYLVLIVVLLLFTLWSIIVSVLNWFTLYQIIIGFKYDILPLFVLLSAIFVGFLLKEEIERIRLVYVIYNFLFYFLILNLIIGLLKIVFPKAFYFIWYGSLRDFIPSAAPPVYYTSWPWGVPRLSWLFGWPNEFWFFLVFILPFIWYVWNKLNTLKKLLKLKDNSNNFLKRFFDKLYLLWLFEGLLTLSRGFILWFFVEVLFVFYKKLLKHFVLAIFIIIFFVVWIYFLNKARPLSTNDHFILMQLWIEKVVDKPLWYGLWTSWPSAYYTTKSKNLYNIKKNVPENTYLQIAIDTGIIWLFLFILFWFLIVLKLIQDSKRKALLWRIRLMIFYWLMWLMIEWMFLHIFWDSMVVYLVSIILGLLMD